VLDVGEEECDEVSDPEVMTMDCIQIPSEAAWEFGSGKFKPEGSRDPSEPLERRQHLPKCQMDDIPSDCLEGRRVEQEAVAGEIVNLLRRVVPFQMPTEHVLDLLLTQGGHASGARSSRVAGELSVNRQAGRCPVARGRDWPVDA